MLLSGLVVLSRGDTAGRRAMLAAVAPPAVIGEEALALGVRRASSAHAVQESFAFVLQNPELSALVRESSALAENVRRWLLTRLEWFAGQRADDVLLDLPGRVAKALAELAVDSESLVVSGLSQERLAALARGSRQSVNQVLQDFAARGWLEVDRGKLTLKAPDALARRAALMPGRT